MSVILSSFADEAGPGTAEQVEACARGGLSYIDPRNVDGCNITELPLDKAKGVAELYRQADIRVNMYGSPIGKIDIADDFQIDLGRLEHLAKLRDIFGANAVRIFSYYNKSGVDKAKWRGGVMDRLRRLRDRAGELGMVLYHENESEIYGDHPEQVLDIAELRDDKTFRLIYDFANYLRTDATPVECWRAFRDKTDCFHLKDQRHDGQHVPMGRGDTESHAILKEAFAAGWGGPCVIEPHLTHSDAVMATGASGSGDVSLARLSAKDSFHVAVEAVQQLLKATGAWGKHGVPGRV